MADVGTPFMINRRCLVILAIEIAALLTYSAFGLS
jgi:hypothetical protein